MSAMLLSDLRASTHRASWQGTRQRSPKLWKAFWRWECDRMAGSTSHTSQKLRSLERYALFITPSFIRGRRQVRLLQQTIGNSSTTEEHLCVRRNPTYSRSFGHSSGEPRKYLRLNHK